MKLFEISELKRKVWPAKRAVTKLEDTEGIKQRVMQNTVFIDTFKTLGASVVPLTFDCSMHRMSAI